MVIYPRVLIVDRIVSGIAVCERDNGSHMDIPVTAFPFPIKEGDCIKQLDENTFAPDPQRTAELREKMIEFTRSLLED